jgi:septum formation protein
VATDSARTPRLILASASPRRRELMACFGLNYTVQPAAIDESPRAGEQARDYVVRMAEEKALAVAARHPEQFVLAADTSVVLEGRILGKPATPARARSMLQSLSDRVHQVITAVSLITPGANQDRRPHNRLSSTDVWFAELSAAWIEAYVASGDPMDKAGAYGIQNAAGLKIRRIDGSYSGVVGLPLYETAALLEAAGLLGPSQGSDPEHARDSASS